MIQSMTFKSLKYKMMVLITIDFQELKFSATEINLQVMALRKTEYIKKNNSKSTNRSN